MVSSVVVLGANGMLGHRLVRHLAASRPVLAVARRPIDVERIAGAHAARVTPVLIADLDLPVIAALLDRHRPAAMINAVGIVKQRPSAADHIAVIRVNALFPHEVAAECLAHGCRFIHISTDCVFSGKRGAYSEDDTPDPIDLYGRAKLLGEVSYPGCLTIRTSLIGPELGAAQGLLEWFRSQRGGVVHGYRRAIFSGLPTVRFARLIADVLDAHPALSGLYHVASEPISKHALLHLINTRYDLRVTVVPADEPVYDRSLDQRRFADETGFRAEPWPTLIDEMAQDETRALV